MVRVDNREALEGLAASFEWMHDTEWTSSIMAQMLGTRGIARHPICSASDVA